MELTITVPWLHGPQFCEGQLRHFTQNGTVSKFKSQLLFASLNKLNFRLPTLRGFNSHLVRSHFYKLDQSTVLDLPPSGTGTRGGGGGGGTPTSFVRECLATGSEN